ncbi:polyprenyl diphosphate synthase [Dasania marina]|uniref:polyprenyl diphosphate synthase n=1 Tax=Dasania marina TaxID=471499 RepID=UPI0003705698|nr:polyprenyl diphosphate synthase [Dasania marina]
MPDSSDSDSGAAITLGEKAGDFAVIPQHIAFIMDGNSRWAKQHGKSTTSGHTAGVESVRKVLQMAMGYGIQVVTLFAFSSENWQRPALEVKALMQLFASYLKKEMKRLHADGVQMRFIGNRNNFSTALRKQMAEAERLTANNDKAVLVLAVDYGGQWDIANAAKILAGQVQRGELALEQVDSQHMAKHMALADLPAPDLCVRTADEHRISNFLLWQLAYAELFFSKTLWPDFSELDLREALAAYAQRDRRFGARKDADST